MTDKLTTHNPNTTIDRGVARPGWLVPLPAEAHEQLARRLAYMDAVDTAVASAVAGPLVQVLAVEDVERAGTLTVTRIADALGLQR